MALKNFDRNRFIFRKRDAHQPGAVHKVARIDRLSTRQAYDETMFSKHEFIVTLASLGSTSLLTRGGGLRVECSSGIPKSREDNTVDHIWIYQRGPVVASHTLARVPSF
jgi:hypothetical protein